MAFAAKRTVRAKRVLPAVLSAEDILGILQEHSADLKRYSVRRIGLFGSYVRGEQKSRSDVDFLVEFDPSSFGENFKGYFDAYMGLSAFLKKVLGKRVDLLTDDMISPYLKPLVLQEVKYLERP